MPGESETYVIQFVDIEETGPPPEVGIDAEGPLPALAQRWEAKCRWGQMDTFKSDVTRTIQAIYSYLHHARTDFETPRDPFHLRGEDNLLSHRPVKSMAVCVHPDDTLFDVAARIAAGRIAGCDLILSLPDHLEITVTTFLDGQEGRRLTRTVKVVRQTFEEAAALTTQVDRLRYASPDRVPAQVYEAAARTGTYIARTPVAMDGRIELIHYYLGQPFPMPITGRAILASAVCLSERNERTQKLLLYTVQSGFLQISHSSIKARAASLLPFS